MPPFEGDMSLRDSVVFFFNYAISMLNGEYAEVERLEVLAEKSYHAMKAYLDAAAKANEKFQQSQDRIMAQIDIFASQNDITLTEGTSKTTANLKISNIVYSYSNQIYLIYFRGALEDNFIVEAINNSDTLLLKLHIDSLTAAYKLGEDEIKGISAYNRDNSLVLACKKSIAHYKKQATVSLPKILEYYRAEDYFNKVKAKYDAKSQSEITQDDVNEYNFAASRYNNSVNVFNQTIKIINSDIRSNQKQWQDAVDKFLKTHIPK